MLFIKTINLLGDDIWIITAVAFVICGYLASKYYRRQSALLFLTLLNLPYSMLLKVIFRHERPPYLVDQYTHFSEYYSFPSTHVVHYVVFWGFVLYLSIKLGRINKWLRILFGSWAFLSITFVGYARVIVGAHWTQDVVGGYLLGLPLLILFIWIEHKIQYPKIETLNEE